MQYAKSCHKACVFLRLVYVMNSHATDVGVVCFIHGWRVHEHFSVSGQGIVQMLECRPRCG